MSQIHLSWMIAWGLMVLGVLSCDINKTTRSQREASSVLKDETSPSASKNDDLKQEVGSQSLLSSGEPEKSPAAEGWQSLPVVPSRGNLTSVSFVWVGTKILVFGGAISSNSNVETSDECFVFDTKNPAAWKECSRVGRPSSRYNAALVAYDSYVLLVGGSGSKGGPHNEGLLDAALYHVPTDRWLPLPDAPNYYEKFDQFHEFPTKLLLWSGAGFFGNHLAVFDKLQQKWLSVAQPGSLIPSRGASSVALGSGIVAFGEPGSNGQGIFGATYNLDSNRWQSLPPPPGFGAFASVNSFGFAKGDEFFFYEMNSPKEIRGFRHSFQKAEWSPVSLQVNQPEDFLFLYRGLPLINRSGSVVLRSNLDHLYIFDVPQNTWRRFDLKTATVFHALPNNPSLPTGHTMELLIDWDGGLYLLADSKYLYRYEGDVTALVGK